MNAKLAFSENLRQRLEGGKYTHWAVTLTEDTLESLLWMVGEIGVRLPLLDSVEKTFPRKYVAGERMEAALRTIAQIVDGEEIGIEEATQRIVDAVSRERNW